MIKVKFYNWDNFLAELSYKPVGNIVRFCFKLEHDGKFNHIYHFYLIAGYVIKVDDILQLNEYKTYLGHFSEGDSETFDKLLEQYKRLEKSLIDEITNKMNSVIIGHGIFDTVNQYGS